MRVVLLSEDNDASRAVERLLANLASTLECVIFDAKFNFADVEKLAAKCSADNGVLVVIDGQDFDIPACMETLKCDRHVPVDSASMDFDVLRQQLMAA